MKRFPPLLLLACAAFPLASALSSYTSIPVALGSLELLAKLPGEIVESSGLEMAGSPGQYWTHNDAGNLPILYKVNEQGKLLSQTQIQDVSNNDWEDLAQDNKGYLYIGDVGNNKNERQDLKIYKVAPKQGFKVQTIKFRYQDQPTGKVEKELRNFDCEGFFWHNNKLYLLSKDRGQKRTSKLYELSDQAGTHTAKLVSKTQISGEVTSADVSPDGSKMAVLTYGKLYLYPIKKGSNQFFSQKPQIITLPKAGKSEAILFKDNKTLVMSNEEGDLFQYAL
ncbi:hypothetical protein GU926_16945 [Nibribacter ruber]|uniref:Uncharacterized protein n=1 Tax=Nibribacter ruber TaxID=2698458 RepID=A0A6P1P3Q8_9BACT|nr:hypothetical protein [Nibribacter ruber]QHL89021.1 hypothetical protein GU926_16945 [Nibribacter ruber]